MTLIFFFSFFFSSLTGAAFLTFALQFFSAASEAPCCFRPVITLRLSKAVASLGFTSVSSLWEVVYYFLPAITGQSPGSSPGSGIVGFCQNTTSVPGLAAGLAAAGCCPQGWCRWGWRDAGCGVVPVGQWDGDRRVLPVGCGMLPSSRARRTPGSASSAHVSSKTVRPFSGVRCVLSLYLDAAPLLNLVSPH